MALQSMTFEGSHLEDVPYLGLPEVAVFGRSNVGKSSLLNCLAGVNKAVAIVSKTPGRTQVRRSSLDARDLHAIHSARDVLPACLSGLALTTAV